MEEKEINNAREEIKEDSQKEKKSSKKIIKYVAYFLFVIIATALAIFFTVYKNFDEIIHQLLNCDWRWLIVVFALILLPSIIRSFILFCFARLYSRDYKLHQAYAVDQIGQFYNAVTPGAQGGQFMQAYTYKKQGIQISSAVSILAMYSIMFQIVLILYGIISFIIKYNAINSIGTIAFQIADWKFSLPIWPLTIIGFGLNIGVIAMVLLMGYWKSFHRFIMGPCITFFSKIRIIKNPDKTRENLRTQVENFKIEMRRLFSNIPFTLLVAFSFFVYITVKYSTPFFVGKALGNQSTSANFWDAIFLSNYHQMVTGLIPIPGSAGISEYFFNRLFVSSNPTASNSFFFKAATDTQIYSYMMDNPGKTYMEAKAILDSTYSQSLGSAALLIWRSVTFIIPVAIGGIVTALYRATPKNISENKEMRSGTFIELQRETMLERNNDMETMVQTNRLKRAEVVSMLKSLNKNDKKKKETKKHNKHPNKYDDVNINEEDDSL